MFQNDFYKILINIVNTLFLITFYKFNFIYYKLSVYNSQFQKYFLNENKYIYEIQYIIWI